MRNAFTLDEAFEMDEFFLTSTTSEVTPVISIDGRPVSSGILGPVTMKLQKAFSSQIPSLIADE